jgi:hypothetical protein
MPRHSMIVSTMLARCLVASVAVALLPVAGVAAVRFELPTVYQWALPDQPTVGYFDVVVRAEAGDLPQQVSSFNVDVKAPAATATLGPPQVAPSPLIAGMPLNQSPNAHTLRASREIFPNSVPLVDGAGLVRVPFTLPAGMTGSFTLSFGNLNELANPSADALPTDVSDTGLLVVANAGDFNRNGVIDGADFLVWQRTLGQPVAPIGSGADANRDGLIAGTDLLAWRTATSAQPPATAATTAIPEPATWALIVATIAVLASLGRRSAPGP